MTITNALDKIKLIQNYLETESIAYLSDIQIFQYHEMERLSQLRIVDLLEILEYLFS